MIHLFAQVTNDIYWYFKTNRRETTTYINYFFFFFFFFFGFRNNLPKDKKSNFPTKIYKSFTCYLIGIYSVVKLYSFGVNRKAPTLYMLNLINLSF